MNEATEKVAEIDIHHQQLDQYDPINTALASQWDDCRAANRHPTGDARSSRPGQAVCEGSR